jgi:DNA-binding transcriptional LysR family regulator
VRSALDVPRERQEPEGLLRITAAPDVGATFLARIITRFTARYPAVRIDLLSTTRVVDLLKDGFDAAIRAVSTPIASPSFVASSSFVARKLTVLDFQIYGSASYLARRGAPRTPGDLSRHDWIEFRGWKHSRALASVSLSKRAVNNDFLFIREALRAGGGLGFLPTFLARADVESGSLTQVLPDHGRSGGRLVILYAKQKQLPRRVSVFRDFLLESFGERS